MANRRMRMPRHPFANTGMFGRLTPIHRQIVNPGETLKHIRCKARLQSLPVKYSLTGCTVDVWFFHVPMRVCDPDFPEFIMDQGGSLTSNPVPRTTHFQVSSTEPNLYGKAYENIVNHYFRTDDDTPFEWSGGGGLASLPIIDQTADVMGDTDLDDEDETIDVSGGTLSLKALAQARAKLAYERGVERMDGRYTSFLQRFGVRINESALQLPELIGSSRKYVFPSKSVDQSSGYTVQSYFHDINVKFQKPRYFMEHGFVLGFIALRPKVLIRGGNMVEDFLDNPESWPFPGQLEEHRRLKDDTLEASSIGGTTGDTEWNTIDHVLLHGQHLVNNSSPPGEMSLKLDPTTVDNAKYPFGAWDTMIADTSPLSGFHFQIDGVCGSRIATPLRLRTAR